MLPFIHNNLLIRMLWSAVVFASVGIDALRFVRIHPAFLRGAIVANVALYIAHFSSTSIASKHFASRLVA